MSWKEKVDNNNHKDLELCVTEFIERASEVFGLRSTKDLRRPPCSARMGHIEGR